VSAAIEPIVPAGACDCHTHVFGPPALFPFDPARTYTPGEASVEALVAHQAALGMARVVIVQPSPYGTDNTCTLDAVRRLGTRARAVAVVAPDIDAASLRAMHDAGVRGVRLNLETVGMSDPGVASELLRRAAEMVAPLGWHVQTYTNLGVIAALHGVLSGLAAPLVVDHFGRAMAAGGVDQAGFAALLDLVSTGKAYVKLSAAHRIAADPDEAGPIARALIAANPARMLWGSDWPHPGGRAGRRDPAVVETFEAVDDRQALARLLAWAGDAAGAILVDNPARVYGF
jgi:predicted TIM-barrel fold metal-dependent hydrolase